MPGAIIVPDQPTGAGAGTPGVSRSDLWQGRALQLSVGVGGNTTFLWELVTLPPGSGSTLTGSTLSTASFTPDVRGTYRLKLTTNGGGPGNVKIVALRVTRSNSGVVLGRGWSLPAFGERAGEDNAGGNTRGHAPLFESIFTSLESELDGVAGSIGSMPSVIAAVKYREIPILAVEQSTLEVGFMPSGWVALNLAKYPAAIGALVRTFQLQLVVSASGQLGDDLVPWVVQARMYNSTHGYVVTGSTLSGSTAGDVSQPKILTSSALPVGTTSGTLRTDSPAVYGVEFKALGVGVLAAPEHVTIHSANLLLEYV